MYNAQQCWPLANNVNHGVERACRTQPTRNTRARSHLHFGPGENRRIFPLGPCQALSSARKTTPDPVQLSQFRGPSELVSPLRFSRRIKYASDSAVIVADVIYRPAARTIFYGARGEEERHIVDTRNDENHARRARSVAKYSASIVVAPTKSALFFILPRITVDVPTIIT